MREISPRGASRADRYQRGDAVEVELTPGRWEAARVVSCEAGKVSVHVLDPSSKHLPVETVSARYVRHEKQRGGDRHRDHEDRDRDYRRDDRHDRRADRDERRGDRDGRNHRGDHRMDRRERDRDERSGGKKGGRPAYLTRRRDTGRNTESFTPSYERPAMRVIVSSPKRDYRGALRHDDVVIVPEFFCREDDLSLYNLLCKEQEALPESEWVDWHEGAHLVTKKPDRSPTFQQVLKGIERYFKMTIGGVRFNWYRDSKDWKPYHHDSHAFNAQRAKTQNVTVGASFGANRELSFSHAETRVKTHFPQPNGSMFLFGRDVNITWKHGIVPIPEGEHDPQGRVSIIAWGWVDALEEPGSPPPLS